MELSPRKPSKRMPEPVDEWLHSEGYFRKHAPRDPTCLFRAISEQVYLTQHFHIRVRQECVQFMSANRHLFEESVSIPFESYLEQMACFTEWGGSREIEAMSLVYHRDVVLFNGQHLTQEQITDNGFDKIVNLCFTPQKQYESVYARDFIATAAFCQSIIYQTLYKDVFQMADVDLTVFKMLHDRSNNIRHDRFFLKENLEIREQLTVELLGKLAEGGEESEDAQAISRGFTPFPYRVAKALDPNIYRNTDFDIWHEIRREVRNAGWMRFNGTELQVGGKCLVQMDTKENDLDIANNNSNCEMDNNGNSKETKSNEQKSSKKSGKQDPQNYTGHIQEMSKNEGPVVVFIEELGEKRTVPYASLKPISSRKRQSNWALTTCKKSGLFDSGHKWKKSWYGNSRKIKDLAANLNTLTMSNIDKNNNKNEGEESRQWDNESGHGDEMHSTISYQAYTMERFTSYQGFAANTSIDVRPVSVVLENPQPVLTESLQQDIPQVVENCAATSVKSTDGRATPNEAQEKPVSVSPANTEASLQAPQNCIRSSQSELYPTQPGAPQYFTGNANVYYGSLDGSVYPAPQYFIGNGTPYSQNPGDPQIHASQVNQALQSVNFSAQKSIEANGNDLPLSDMVTLRFFYNLGLEYFRASYNWVGCTSGQAISFGPCYVTQGNVPGQYNTVTDTSTSNEGEISRINQSVQQNLVISSQKGEWANNSRDSHPNSNGKGQGKATNPNGPQKLMNPRNESQSTPESKVSPHTALTRDCSPYSPSNDKPKEAGTSIKDNQRANRSSMAPRFKKNYDGRYRNSRQQQQQQQQQQHQFQYQQNAVNVDVQNTRNVGTTPSHNGGGQPASPSGQNTNSGPPPASQSPANQVPYTQQPLYAPMPYYQPETESCYQNAYYPSNPGYSYIPHSDITDGNNVNHYPPSMYPNPESYGQPYPVYPQYVYPPNMYPTMPPQTAQENWYAVPAQAPLMPAHPHYFQYTATPPPPPITGSPNGLHNSNVSK